MKREGRKKAKGRRPARGQPAPSAIARSTPQSRALPSLAALLVFVVSFLLYANTLDHGFVWDDADLIVENPAIGQVDLQTAYKIFTEDFWPSVRRGGVRLDERFEADRSSYYRPVVTLSYHVDYRLFNGEAAGFHWINVLLNAATCVMVFVFVYLLFGSTMLGLVTAILFSVHPVHTESVAWISGRTDVVATLWSLVSLSLYVIARRRGSLLLLLTSLGAFAIAMLAKETAALVPVIVVLLEFGPFDYLLASVSREASNAVRSRHRVLTVLLFFGVLALYLIVRRGILGTATSPNTPIASDTIGQVALPLSIFAGYVHKVLLPLELTADFTVPVPTSMAGLPLVGAALGVLTVLAAWRFRRRPAVVLGIAIFVLGIAPVLHLIPIAQMAAERFLYLPSLGVALILGYIFTSALVARYPALRRVDGSRKAMTFKVPPRFAMPLVVILALTLLLSSVHTIRRNSDWKNDETLFTKTALQAPDSPLAQLRAASIAHQKGDIDEAVRAYEQALRISPEYAPPNWGLALIRLQQGDTESARVLLQRAARGGKDYRGAYYHLARLENEAGNKPLAKQYARQFLSLYDKDDAHREEVEKILRGE